MSYNIFTAGVTVLGVAFLVCGLPLCCYDSYMKSQEAKRREEEEEKERRYYEKWGNKNNERRQANNNELPKKILEFKTAMKDISFNV